MRTAHRLPFRAPLARLTVALLVLAGHVARAITPAELLLRAERPPIALTASVPRAEMERTVGTIHGPDAIDRQVLAVYEQVVRVLIERAAESEVFLFARDMEDLDDALRATLSVFAGAERLARRIHVLHVSRELAEHSTDEQLRHWLSVQGLDAQALSRGQTKALLLDTGYSGRIYRRVFQALLSGIDASAPDAFLRTAAIIDNVDPRLLASRHSDSYASLREALRRGSYASASAIRSVFQQRDFGFGELFPPQTIRALGLPRETYEHCQFYIDNVERRRPNWRPRGLRLVTDGSALGELESTSARDARIDRPRLLRYQLLLHAWFTDTAFTTSLRPVVEGALAKLPPPSAPAIDPPLEAFRPGAELSLGEGVTLRLDSASKEGTSRRVLAGALLPSGKAVAVKVADPGSQEAIDSIARDADRTVELTRLGFPVASLLRHGPGYTVREWIQGARGDEWLAAWERSGGPADDPALVALGQLLRKLAGHGIYVRSLRPSDLVWTGSQWWIVNCGDVVTGRAPDETIARYREKFAERWARRFLGPRCSTLLQEAIR